MHALAAAPHAKPMSSATSGILVQRCGDHACPKSGCLPHIEREKSAHVQRSAFDQHRIDVVPPLVHQVVARSGHPLPDDVRGHFEGRFQHDLSRVRVHSDAQAETSARQLNARAYTVGRHIAFSAGRYSPDTASGRQLLAHELTHVIQQRDYWDRSPSSLALAAGSGTLEQEADMVAASTAATVSGGLPASGRPSAGGRCGSAVTAPSWCSPPGDHHFVPGSFLINYKANCDEPANATEEKKLLAVPALIAPTSKIEIHGYASLDGPAPFNETLACARADNADRQLSSLLAPGSIAAVVSHGPTAGPAADRRSVVIVELAPKPVSKPSCGPDATDWFVDQVNRALKDPVVLRVQFELTVADVIARGLGTSARDVAEGGAGAAVETAEAALAAKAATVGGPAPPLRDPTISGFLGAATASRSSSKAAILAKITSDPVPAVAAAIEMVTHMSAASLLWAALVNHGARYDFKAHILNHLTLGACPDAGCRPGPVGNLTLCPTGATTDGCFEADLPGNLFYALVGRFVGFSRLTLQLGSQLAELTDPVRPGHTVISWDSPEDTAAINLGFALGGTLPLTRSSLCSGVTSVRASLDHVAGCNDCMIKAPSTFV